MRVELLDSIRATRPQVHCITNPVTINYVANMTMGLGASFVGSDAPEEAADIASKSKALMLNIGMPNDSMANSMIVAGRKANELGMPVVFDPDGAGSSYFRREIANEILNNISVTCIRGTAEDLAALMDWQLEANAVLSFDDLQVIADKYQTTVVMTGREDLIVHRASQARIMNDIPFMRRMAGNGAALCAVIASFLAVGDITDPFDAVVTAVAAFDVAGQRSEQKYASVGSASFAYGIIDEISEITANVLSAEAKLQIR